MKFLCLIFSCFMLGITIKADEAVFDYKGWVAIKNEQLKIALKLPANYKKSEQIEEHIQVYSAGGTTEKKDREAAFENISIESKLAIEDLNKMKESLISKYKGADGKQFYLHDKEVKLGGQPAWLIAYHFKADGFENTSELYVTLYKKYYYYVTFTCRSMSFMQNKQFRDQVLASINLEAMQASIGFELVKPKDWFNFKDNDFSLAFSKKDNGGKSLGDGVIKAKAVHVDSNMSLMEFTADYLSEIKKSGKTNDGISKIRALNGRDFNWFDVQEKENLFKERYHFAKEGNTFFVIYFISNKDVFESDLKKVLAECLTTFKLLEAK